MRGHESDPRTWYVIAWLCMVVALTPTLALITALGAIK